MKRMFAPNIDNKGRLMRAAIALVLFIAAGLAYRETVWLSMVLGLIGIFVLFEALRGWCALRACGIKTRL